MKLVLKFFLKTVPCEYFTCTVPLFICTIRAGRPSDFPDSVADELLESATDLMSSEQARTMAGFDKAGGPRSAAEPPLMEVDPGLKQSASIPPITTHQPTSLPSASTVSVQAGPLSAAVTAVTMATPKSSAPSIISLGGHLYQPAFQQVGSSSVQQFQSMPPPQQNMAARQPFLQPAAHPFLQLNSHSRQQQAGGWSEVHIPNPPAANSASLAVLRACLTNLAHLSDADMLNTDFNVLIQLNKAARAQPPSDMQAVAAQAFAAAAAAHMAPPQHSLPDPGVKMAKNLEFLKSNPVNVEAGTDDRSFALHPARFMGGMACSAQKMCLEAREVHGLDGILPLANYDMAASGLGGCVTARGWLELHNPASTHLTIKLFSASNLGSSTGNTRRLTLAGDEDGISIGEHLKEIEDLEELQQAMRVLCRAAQLTMPWNHSFNALDGFLHTSKWGAAELAGNGRRAATLTKFVNHVIGLNAEAWQLKNPFVSIGELKTRWTEWLATRPASEYTPFQSYVQASFQSGQAGAQAGGQASRSARKKAARQQQFQQVQHFTLPNLSTPPPNQGQGGRPASTPKYCRKYNAGTCLNAAGHCRLPSGTPLLHRCDKDTGNGVVCGGGHAKINHH
jgi:hypothetical protein